MNRRAFLTGLAAAPVALVGAPVVIAAAPSRAALGAMTAGVSTIGFDVGGLAGWTISLFGRSEPTPDMKALNFLAGRSDFAQSIIEEATDFADGLEAAMEGEDSDALSANHADLAADPLSGLSAKFPDASTPSEAMPTADAEPSLASAVFSFPGGTPSSVPAALPADRTARLPTAPAAPVMPAASIDPPHLPGGHAGCPSTPSTDAPAAGVSFGQIGARQYSKAREALS